MKITIIGAGIAGLIAAQHLEDAGHEVHIVEASDRVGGRIKTDSSSGFLMDRGFQVMLTEYPEAKKYLDYDALDLKHFLPASYIINKSKKLVEVGDPDRNKGMYLKTLFSGVGTLNDKFKIRKLKKELLRTEFEDCYLGKEFSAIEKLREEYGFSERMIEEFFIPFFKGIFLESELETSSRMFDMVFSTFSKGFAAVPNLGMEEIPKQLKSNLKTTKFSFHKKVEEIEGTKVRCKGGEWIEADKLIIATDPSLFFEDRKPVSWHGTTCAYFEIPKDIVPKKQLILNANANDKVSNLTQINKIAPGYAPEGKKLLSISLSIDEKSSDVELMQSIAEEMKPYFGAWVDKWEFIKSYHIPQSLPQQNRVSNFCSTKDLNIKPDVFLAGDYTLNSSINGAMKSGRLAAAAVMGRILN